MIARPPRRVSLKCLRRCGVCILTRNLQLKQHQSSIGRCLRVFMSLWVVLCVVSLLTWTFIITQQHILMIYDLWIKLRSRPGKLPSNDSEKLESRLNRLYEPIIYDDVNDIQLASIPTLPLSPETLFLITDCPSLHLLTFSSSSKITAFLTNKKVFTSNYWNSRETKMSFRTQCQEQ